MSGTPLENNVQEFVRLTSLLDPDLANTLDRYALASGPQIFKRTVAPVYLRRNADEVLNELPELIEVSEFCEWTGADYNFYVACTEEGNLMGMRRAGLRPAFHDARPSKLTRLLEITEEAFASGEKVLVYSYFLDNLDLIAEALGSKAIGPITGATSPSQRQELVDKFHASPEPLALIGQIQAAGTGLNIQAASIVIICEPQIKPSLETQAIARARRMGQLRRVQVHRLLIPDSVDETMVAILDDKQATFEAYARDSDLADMSSNAKDKSEESIAKLILLEERRRLGMHEKDSDK
jgi:SNF2 family DNA or RNA helicase